MRSVLPILMLLAACSSGTARERDHPFLPDQRQLAKTLVYECLGYEFIARLGPGEMAVWLRDEYLILSQVRSASGVKYQEGDVIFWTKGEETTLFLGGQRHGECSVNAQRAPWEDARRRGINFRAAGNEPGWVLEISDEKQLLFVGDYSMNRVLTPDPGAQAIADGRIYHAITEANELIVEINDTECRDSMSGASYASEISITLNGEQFSGCGMALDYPWK
jgi:membrane-bound inhibitor of C-type lysozyme